ncbi:MAG TPA: hypothetical protein VGN88_04430, partial [Phycisphaerae bacterium]
RQASGFLQIDDIFAMYDRSSPALWHSEMLCHLPYNQNAVFASFSPSVHVRALPGQPSPGAIVQLPADGFTRKFTMENLIAGIDFGWKTFACLWIAMLRDLAGNRVAWVLDEYIRHDQILSDHIAALKSRAPAVTETLPENSSPPLSQFPSSTIPWQTLAYYCDVAGSQHNPHTGLTSLELLKASGLPVKARPMNILDGIGKINTLLAATRFTIPAPRLLIHPRCKSLILALQSYELKNGLPLKDNIHDHPLDALRYALVGHDPNPHKLEVRYY